MDQMPNMDDLYNFETSLLRGVMVSHIKRSLMVSLLWLLVVTFITNRLFSYTLLSSIVSGGVCASTMLLYLVFLYTRQYRRQVRELAHARLARDLVKELNDQHHHPGAFRRHVFGDRNTEDTNPPTE